MTADETKKVQRKLTDMGHYNGKVDGVVGPDTEAAIRHFQKEKNLPETGRLDGKTRAALGIK
jgi:peptidoglycan hydrolase-like protein with peptidoglycan-binding domain